MPRYAIERQYLLPVFHHLIVDVPEGTENPLDAACRLAIDNDDWPEAGTKLDFDSARPTTIAAAVVVDDEHRDEDATWLLYEAGLPQCEIPDPYTEAQRELHVLTVQWRSWERTVEVFDSEKEAAARVAEIAREEYPDEDGDLDAFTDHDHNWWIDAVRVHR